MEVGREQHSEQEKSCVCFSAPDDRLALKKDLGADEHYAEVSLLVCLECGKFWLKYFYEIEAFTASGRWYLGAVTAGQAAQLTAENAKATLEGLGWYFYGGSYYQGQTGKSSGVIGL